MNTEQKKRQRTTKALCPLGAERRLRMKWSEKALKGD